MREEENLLTSEEIKIIEEEAKDPIYREPNMLHLGSSHISILKVSLVKSVILIRGNEFTGLEHINQRHDPYQNRAYWIKSEDDKGKVVIRLDNPSKFSNQSIPIFTYTMIAESIFSSENKKPEENKRPDLFDVYSGEYLHKDGTLMKYRLVAYKDTKIIHTLIPLKRTFTKDKILNLRRGGVSGEQHLFEDNVIVQIPYLDHEDKIVCKLIFSINGRTLIEEVFVEYYKKEGIVDSYKVAERKMEVQVVVPRYMTYLEFADLKEFEKIIKKIVL